MPRNGHLKWKAVYQPGKVVAIGYKNGKRILTETVETTRPASKIVLKADRQTMKADGRDVSVVTVEVQDNKGRIVPNACPMLTFRLEGDHEFGIPAFNGLAQLIIQSGQIPSALTLSCTADGLKQGFLSLTTANRGE